jgi:Zn-dependent metalloprotease
MPGTFHPSPARATDGREAKGNQQMRRVQWAALGSALAVVAGGAMAGTSPTGTSQAGTAAPASSQRTVVALPAADPSPGGPAVTGPKASPAAIVRPAPFVATEPGRPIPLPGGTAAIAADPAAAARVHLRVYGDRFGIRDPRRELATSRTVRTRGGQRIVRFQQLRDGVPVLGGELAVTLDDRAGLISVNGEASRSSTVHRPARIGRDAAAELALADTARRERRAPASLAATEPATWLYDPALFGVPGLPAARTVWRVEVSGAGTGRIRRLVLVDAADGRIALSLNQIAAAREQVVCDAAERQATIDKSGRGTNACDGAPDPAKLGYAYQPAGADPSPTTDVGRAWLNVDAAARFYADKVGVDLTALLGYDAKDGRGRVLRSTIRHCVAGADCPYPNAYWDSSIRSDNSWRGQMYFGTGFASADDVVAHELTHGVTERNAGLLYLGQAGAINESLSDVFGELADLAQATGFDDDGEDVRWQIGEDLPAEIGAIRDMADPTRFDQPDRMTSPHWKSDWDDNGGVHRNSGVGNKAAALIVDGTGSGTFNNVSVAGIGVDKAARIYYRVEQTLTSGGDYAQLYRVLPQACRALVAESVQTAAGPVEEADCGQVQAAVDATEMGKAPVTEPVPAPAPVCATGEHRGGDLAFDGFEPGVQPAGFTWKSASPAWTAVDAYTLPVSGEQDGRQLFGPDPPTAVDYAKEMATGVAIPVGAKAYARFNHAHAFDWQDPVAGLPRAHFDGGFVEVSVDGGAWAPATFAGNGQTSKIVAAGNRLGFGGDSRGWLSSRVDLSGYAGHSVRLRFRIVSDAYPAASAGYGWFVDNVRIYSCGTPVPAAPRAVRAVGGSGQATVSWTAPQWPGSGPVTGYEVTATPGGHLVTAAAGSTSVVVGGLGGGTSYSFAVRARGPAGLGAAAVAAAAATALSFGTPPASVDFATKVTVSGRLVRTGTTTGIANAPVQLRRRSDGGAAWTVLATVRTGATGVWTTPLSLGRSFDYSAAYLGGTGHLAATSTTRTTLVRYRVTAAPSATRPAAGRTVRISGWVAPARSGTVVELRRQTSAGWVTLATATTRADGWYAFSRGYARGTWTLRTLVRGNTLNALGASPLVILRVS